ncbi:leucine-rich repeat transmembrane protein kinase protein [Tanacetum coccineum]|uniref:Leucine-rich repeat transmembrane protein kinase protein n=1 Tax=Tanacetum coccineum TaxID=301880 RepID=A0ABQ5F0S0_9ASTR
MLFLLRWVRPPAEMAINALSLSVLVSDLDLQKVKLLMDIRHKNITSLVGYCNDSNHKAIIYEYMANGNLEQHLFGLVYMHHGCRPPVVHRDVKSSNILLDEGFRAKLADFGLSRVFTTEDATYAQSTVVAGTCGYLDPEYYITRRLTEKSDVYSFGVVLLELITSRPAISENINIINWVKSRIGEGSVEDIVDPRLRGIFNIDNAWKLVELAIECVSNTATKRPAMNDVAMDLKHCLQAEKTPQRTKSSNQSGYAPLNLEVLNDPDPR